MIFKYGRSSEGTHAASYRSRDSIHPSPRYEAEYCAALWEDVLNSKLRASSAEVKVSPRVMLKERCRDPNVLNNARDYTLHTYKDSVQMEDPLFVCINKVKHREPVFFSTIEEMKLHWQPCLDLTLIAQGVQGAKGRGKSRQPNTKVNGSKTSTQAEAGNSSRIDAPKAGTSTQVDEHIDIQMQDVEELIQAENDSADKI